MMTESLQSLFKEAREVLELIHVGKSGYYDILQAGLLGQTPELKSMGMIRELRGEFGRRHYELTDLGLQALRLSAVSSVGKPSRES